MIALRRWMFETALPPLAFFALFVTLWQAVTVLWNIPLYLVPPPGAYWRWHEKTRAR